MATPSQASGHEPESSHSQAQAPTPAAVLDKPRHVKYWLRNLKTLLPHHYTGNESNRMYLGFFILSALDLLSAYVPSTTAAERQDHVNWIYHCQHPDGGFRMWPGTNFDSRANSDNATWDPAHLPATYFALATLLIVGDDLRRVRRKETLAWLRRMQRADGSFGETCVGGKIEGGQDPRFGYCAMGVRYILRGGRKESGDLTIDGESIPDVKIDAFVRTIIEAEGYDGGIADEKFHEPHAGYTYCALGALSFIDRLKPLATPAAPQPQGNVTQQKQQEVAAIFDPSRTLHWLVSDQTTWIDPYSDDGDQDDRSAAGFSGRPSKAADTCYSWWVCGALHILQQTGRPIYNSTAGLKYLLRKTQHPILGGFSKFPGEPPDLYHAYLGLAATGLVERDGNEVKPVDGGMCISLEAKERVHTLW